MRAILTGGECPKPLLGVVLARIRAGDEGGRKGPGDHVVSGARAALCKAVIARAERRAPFAAGGSSDRWEDKYVTLDRSSTSPAYRLGRLFAVLESAQRAALGNVNATIRDRFFGSASATPASVFPVLMRNANHHLAVLRKGERAGLGVWLERELAGIFGGLGENLPTSLRIEDQGRFVIGYYHQRYARRDDKPEPLAEQDTTQPTGPEEEME